MFDRTATTSINMYFLRIFFPIVLFVSALISGLAAWNDYQANRASRLESQKLIFSTFVATIRQPLIQGSFIEARIRADEVARSPQISCIRIAAGSEIIQTCKHYDAEKSGINSVKADLFFSDDNTTSIGHVAILFDNSDLVRAVWKNVGKNVIGLVLLAIVLFGALLIGFARLRQEFDKVLAIASAQSSEETEIPKFKIREFASLGKKLIRQLEVSKAEVEAKAALDVARQVAHDIRSPIVSLQIAINAAQSKIDPKLKNVLNQSAQRISDIANDVISQHTPINPASRSFANKLPLSVNLALSEMISEKLIMCVDRSEINIRMGDFEKDFFIEMCASDFKRVISNLIDNSIQSFSKAGLVEITLQAQGRECRIAISDNGAGMAAHILKMIVEQGGSYGKPGGRGLGLQWVRKIIDEHSGSFSILSTPNIGTTVTVALPAVGYEKERSMISNSYSPEQKEA